MDISIFIEIISTLGLPIALVIAMGYFIFKLYNQSVVREDKLMEEIEECRTINSQAIETIGLYAERLTHIEGNIAEIKDDVILIKDKIK